MSYFTIPQRRMYCERLVAGKWSAVIRNGKIRYRDVELGDFYDDIYNIFNDFTEIKKFKLSKELQDVINDESVNALRYSELQYFITRTFEIMYSNVVMEVIRNTQIHDRYPIKNAFENAMEDYSRLKMFEKNVSELLADAEHESDSDIRIILV